MHFISGYVNIFLLLIIFWLGKHDMTNAIYEIPALLAVIIGWTALFKSRKKLLKSPYKSARFLIGQEFA